MFKDTKEALKQLEEKLIEKEAPTQVLPQTQQAPAETLRTVIDDSLSEQAPANHPGKYQNFANNYGGKARQPSFVPNTEPEEEPEEELVEELVDDEQEEKAVAEQKLTGLWILLAVLLGANLCVILYWLLRFSGSL